MGDAEYHGVCRDLPPANVLASEKHHVAGAEELTALFAAFGQHLNVGCAVDVPEMGFGCKTKQVAVLSETEGPIDVFRVDPELLIEEAHFAHGAATNHHGAAGGLGDFQLIVELTAIFFPPAAVLGLAGPKVESAAGVPERVGLMGPIDFGTDDGDAGRSP